MKTPKSNPYISNHSNIFSKGRLMALGVGLGLSALAFAQVGAGQTLSGRLQTDESPPMRDGPFAGYSKIVDKVAPSVVSIVATKRGAAQPSASGNSPFPFFQQPGRSAPAPRRGPSQQGLGSGVIITSDGYLVTNHHVVKDAEDIKVVMADGKTEYAAKLVGNDPQTDLAVIKINAKNLPAVTLGDSSQVKTGDFVLALGNPFGLSRSVTSGIVSAIERNNLNIAGYENFIQTDASINPGNSGGALVDNRGRLIGINTAIFSKSGGNNGIGFAIPSNMVKIVSNQLVENGHVERGFLGVTLGELTAELASAFGLDGEDGILVNEVHPNTPAARAGFKSGDVIVKLDGKSVKGMAALRLDVSRLTPDSNVDFVVLRDGKTRSLTAKIGRLNAEALASNGRSSSPSGGSGTQFLDGVELTAMTPQLGSQLKVRKETRGVVVRSIEEGSAADDAGLQAGDVITQVNRKSVSNVQDAINAKRYTKGNTILLRIANARGSRYLAVQVS